MEVHVEEDLVRGVLMHTLKIGQVAVIMNPRYLDKIVLRTYDGLVCLTDPNLTWHNDCSLRGRILPPGTKITLTVTE